MFTQAVADAICERLATGESLRSVCRSEGMPAAPTVLLWASERPEFAEQYARARAQGADMEFERLEELADEQPERDDKGRVDPGWVAWQRGRVDVRKWTLARKQPRKYGDKLDLNHSGAVKFEKIETVVVDPKG